MVGREVFIVTNVSDHFRIDRDAEDPFYSESNMEFMRRGIAELNAGKGSEHELKEEHPS